ncbi:MAG: ABC transporter ATP-binding protein [Rickettsiales bacterium]
MLYMYGFKHRIDYSCKRLFAMVAQRSRPKKSSSGVGSYALLLCREYKAYLAALCGVALLASFFSIAVNYNVKQIIDAIAYDESANLWGLLALFAFYKLMRHGMYFINRLLDIRYKPELLERTVSDMYRKTLGHSLHWFDSHLSGEIASKISDLQTGVVTFITFAFRATVNVLTILMSLAFMVNVHAQPAQVLACFVAIYMPILYALMTRQMRLQEDSVRARQQTVGVVNDSVANIFAVKVIGNPDDEFRSKLFPALLGWKAKDKKTRHFDAWWVDNVDTIMITLMSVGQIYLLARLFQAGEITAGGFAFVSMVTLNIHNELDKFLDSLLFNVNPAAAQIKSSYAFLNEAYDVTDRPDATPMARASGDIEYRDVSFSYGASDTSILRHFNLHIAPGERIGVVGASGAGKTTMIKCLLRYFDAHSGHVLIDGKDVTRVTQESLRANISVIPQDVTMFHRSVRENLRLANIDATDDEIIGACKKAKIHDDIMAMEKGYDSVVGERGVKMSGGQRQRVAIARAILKNAPILILDEATSSLDTPTEALIQRSIEDMLEKGSATVIAIAHRLSTLKRMDRIIVMEKGRIVEEGTHDALIQREGGAYKRLWEMQAI